MNYNEILPETSTQDLGELNGRLKAVIRYMDKATYIDKELVLAMLGYETEE